MTSLSSDTPRNEKSHRQYHRHELNCIYDQVSYKNHQFTLRDTTNTHPTRLIDITTAIEDYCTVASELSQLATVFSPSRRDARIFESITPDPNPDSWTQHTLFDLMRVRLPSESWRPFTSSPDAKVPSVVHEVDLRE